MAEEAKNNEQTSAAASPTSETPEALEPQALPAETQTTEQPTSGSADSGASFTNIDPSKLPPELQPIYKSMQADYTRKTQETAEIRKRNEVAEQLFANPDIQRAIYQTLYPQASQPVAQPPAKEEEDLSQLSEEELFERAVETKVSEKLEEFKAALEPQQKFVYQQNLQSAMTNAIETMRKKYPDFDNYGAAIRQAFSSPQDPTAEKTVEQLVVTGQIVRALDMAYTNLAFPKLVEKSKQDARQEVVQKKAANLPSNTVSPERVVSKSGVDSTKPLQQQIEDAWKEARKQHGVSQ